MTPTTTTKMAEKPMEVITLIPDELYAEFKERAAKGTIYELFAGDTEPTKIWLNEEGVLMSHMPPQDFNKRLKPFSQSEIEKGDWKAGNARGDLILRLLKRGVPREAAHHIGDQIYKKIPLNSYAKDSFVDELVNLFKNND